MFVDNKIISHLTIKPLSRTSHHLQTLKLSSLDQFAPPVYVPSIFFYSQEEQQGHDDDHTLLRDHRAQKSQLLKQSLAKVLTKFYPLAGRIDHENSSVDCRDYGVEYFEVEIDVRMSDVIENPNTQLLQNFLPTQNHEDPYPLGIQINFFECGGIAIGVCLYHSLGDGSSLATFMNSWAATCRGDGDDDDDDQVIIPQPIFDFSTLFPPVKLSPVDPETMAKYFTQKLVTKRFVFNKEKLATLKALVSGPANAMIKGPTRVEAVSGFIWKQIIDMNLNNSNEDDKIYATCHAVNLRSRMNPPLPDHAFGNLWTIADALSLSRKHIEYHDLVGHLRSGIKAINPDYVKKMQDSKAFASAYAERNELYASEKVEFCSFSSWCKFPMYKVDYGWGKPEWVCSTTTPFKNATLLMSTRDGEGVEAWVNMVEADMGVFEGKVKELIDLDAK